MSTSDLDQLAHEVTGRAAALALYARQWVDAATAEDVVQETLISLLGERPAPSNPIAWMYRAVRNAAIDQARSATRRRRREQTVAAARREWFVPRSETRLDAQAAEHALRQLSVDYREVVVLRIWGQLGFAEIAAIMDIAVSTVHDRYNAALKLLRHALEKPCQTKTD